MNVFTYYDARPSAPDDQAERFRQWRQKWAERGWATRILTSRKAKQSPLYEKHFRPELEDLLLPWLALHAAGGGWFSPMASIDPAIEPRKCRYKVRYFPGVMWASKSGAAEVIKKLARVN